MPDFSCLLDGCDRPSKTRRRQGYCNTHAARLRLHGDVGGPELQCNPRIGSVCTVDGCIKQRKSAKFCSMHAARVERHGDVNTLRPNARGRFIQHGPGYVKLTGSTHPLAIGGTVYEHRVVLYDLIGSGAHACNWCGRTVSWSPIADELALEVDHVDGDRVNNDPSNLVPACQHCNKSRRRHYKLDRTHCPNGHAYSPENQVPGWDCRKCLECKRERQRRCDARRRERLRSPRR